MSKEKFERCSCGKRGFRDERAADRALGRAQHKRDRQVTVSGNRRGLKIENRYYECDFGGWHLTSMSSRSQKELVAA